MEQIDLQSNASDKRDGSAPTGVLAMRKTIVELIVLLFGIGSWFGVTTIFSQMPKISASAPEEWLLPFYLSITVQCGNAISLFYVYVRKSSARQLNDAHAICMLMAVGCLAAICMPFMYEITVGNVSIALHIFTFIFATIGGFSSMLFMPYMKRFRANYLFIFFFGQSLNDLVSIALAVIQGMWGSSECIYRETQFPQFVRHTASPLFNSNVAFLLVFPVLAMSTAAFILLNKMKVCRDELDVETLSNDVKTERRCDAIESNDTTTEVRDPTQLNFYHLILANALIGFAATSIFPFIHSFTCQQYSRRPFSYNLTIALIAIYNPLIWFVVTLMPQQCVRLVRMCNARLSILVPYLLFVIFDFFWGWPLHSLLGLILLVS